MSRIYGLDIFRATAILLVIFFHGNYLLEPVLPGFPYTRLPDGVELFFVLSGFLIGGILIKTIEKENTFNFRSLIYFWKRRWMRTLPNYYLVLLLNIIVTYFALNGNLTAAINWKFFLFLQNFNAPFHSFFWESWSLSVEEWFYIFLPVIVMILFIALRNHLSVKWILLTAILLLISFPLVYRYAISTSIMDGFHYDIIFRKTVLTRLDSIIYGVLSAWLYYYFSGFWKNIRWVSFLIGLIALYYFTRYRPEPETLFAQVFYFPLISFCAALMLPLAESRKTYSGWLGKIITHISKISYSMYLLHLGLIASVIQFQVKEFAPLSGIIWFIIYLVTTILASSLLYRYFEKPIMERRK